MNVYSSLLVKRFAQAKVIRVHNMDKLWFSGDCRRVLVKQEAHLWRTLDRSRGNLYEFVRYQWRANEVYAEAMGQFSNRSRDVLMNAKCPHK